MTQLAPHRARARNIALPHGPVAILDTAPGGTTENTALLLPGFTGSKEDFAPILDALATAGYRTVAMDLPGQYESPGPDDPAAYTLAWLASVVREVAAVISPDRPVHLVGHSFGGLVARAAVLADPMRFASLTLLSSGPGEIVGVRRERIASVEPLLPYGSEAIFAAMEAENERTNPRWKAAPTPLKDFMRTRFLASSLAGLKGMADILRAEPDRVPQLRATGVPTLVAYGEYDDAWPPAAQADMARRLGADHVVIERALHSPAVEHPAATVRALTAFWSAQRRPGLPRDRVAARRADLAEVAPGADR